MRVLFHLLDAGVGGGQLVAARVADALTDRGHEVALTVPEAGPAAERFRELGARVVLVDAGSLRKPRDARALARVVRDYDLLYSHTAIPGVIIGAAAARMAGRPHVVHQHTFPYFSTELAGRVAQKGLLRLSARNARFIAVAKHVRDGLVAAGIPRARVEVVPNGVPLIESAPSRGDGPVRVGVLGRLDPGKNIHVFLEAAAVAAPTTPVEYVVGGVSSPFFGYETALREQAASAAITIVGAEDGPAFLKGLDVVVVPSSYEGSPLVLLEAMALGRAVIASDIPGIREVLGPGDAGVLVPPGDAQALAHAIEQLVDNPARRAELGTRAREVASTRYRLDAMLERTVAILEAQARRSKSPSA